MEQQRYYTRLVAAYVRGHAIHTGVPELPGALVQTPLDLLTEEQLAQLMDAGKEADLKLYRFKTTHDDLPRVQKVLGILRSFSFDSLLDVGTGRGVFLLPFLDAFPWVKVTCTDLLPQRTGALREMADGGIESLTVLEADICRQPLPDRSVDIVTALEVLEHIPEVETAIASIVRIARKNVIVSVPSKPDDNPEHIHLLTKEKLSAYFHEAGCQKLKFEGVNGHTILIASIDRECTK